MSACGAPRFSQYCLGESQFLESISTRISCWTGDWSNREVNNRSPHVKVGGRWEGWGECASTMFVLYTSHLCLNSLCHDVWMQHWHTSRINEHAYSRTRGKINLTLATQQHCLSRTTKNSKSITLPQTGRSHRSCDLLRKTEFEKAQTHRMSSGKEIMGGWWGEVWLNSIREVLWSQTAWWKHSKTHQERLLLLRNQFYMADWWC